MATYEKKEKVKRQKPAKPTDIGKRVGLECSENCSYWKNSRHDDPACSFSGKTGPNSKKKRITHALRLVQIYPSLLTGTYDAQDQPEYVLDDIQLITTWGMSWAFEKISDEEASKIPHH